MRAEERNENGLVVAGGGGRRPAQTRTAGRRCAACDGGASGRREGPRRSDYGERTTTRRRRSRATTASARALAAVVALSALSASASAFAPCRGGREQPRWSGTRRDAWGGRRRSAAAAAALAAANDGDGGPPSPSSRRRSVPLSGLFALFRRKRHGGGGRSHAVTRPSLSGDALSTIRQDEFDECMIRMEGEGAGPDESLAICFDPRSFDRGLDNPGVAPTLGDAASMVLSSGDGAVSAVQVRGGSQGGVEDDAADVADEEAVEEEPLIVESALPEPPESEEDEDEICVPVYDVPVTPSYELPKLRVNGKVNGEKTEVNGERREGRDPSPVEGASEDAEAGREGESRRRALCDRGLVLVDSFSPYHGQYLSHMAREAYGAGVVSVLSAYVTGYLFQERGMTEHLSMRLPNLDDYGPDGEVETWANEIPFEIVGIICESDSGLDDAERLGEALGLYPDRHDGFNAGRRDKFLMNEACAQHGLRVVRQRMCGSVEEALEFAAELGIGEGTSLAIEELSRAEDGDEALIEELVEELVEKVERNSVDLRVDEMKQVTESRNGETVETSRVTLDDLDVTNELCNEEPTLKVAVNGDSRNNVNNEGEAAPQDEQRDDDEGEHYMPSNPGVLGPAATSSSGAPLYVVVKPPRGVASDSVHLCPSLRSVERAFDSIRGTTVFGSTHGERHESVLVQEFAAGTEYAVDIVSKAGEHKVAALWRYDKRPANGAPFIYHATELVDADTDVGRAVCEYAMEALDALDVHWGMSHTEIIADEDGSPRLVEVNCRQHNTDFAPLTTACIGYNALDMLLAAYLGDADEFPPGTEHKRLAWADLPDLPVTRGYGAIVHLVSHSEGTLREVNGEALEEMEAMRSVLAMEIYPQFTKVGDRIKKTVDIRTDAGWCHIMNDDPEDFKADYDRIVELMPRLFKVGDGVSEDAEGGKEEAVEAEQLQGAADG